MLPKIIKIYSSSNISFSSLSINIDCDNHSEIDNHEYEGLNWAIISFCGVTGTIAQGCMETEMLW